MIIRSNSKNSSLMQKLAIHLSARLTITRRCRLHSLLYHLAHVVAYLYVGASWQCFCHLTDANTLARLHHFAEDIDFHIRPFLFFDVRSDHAIISLTHCACISQLVPCLPRKKLCQHVPFAAPLLLHQQKQMLIFLGRPLRCLLITLLFHVIRRLILR